MELHIHPPPAATGKSGQKKSHPVYSQVALNALVSALTESRRVIARVAGGGGYT